MEPTYRRTLKEAIVALLLWFGAGVWVISVSYWLASDRPVRSVGGIPNWILWGVLLPWVTLFFVHSWYSLVFLRAGDEEPPAGPPSKQPDGKRAG